MNTKVLLKGKGDDILLPITRGELVLDAYGNEAFRSGQFLATEESHGLMSREDKKKLVTYTLSGNYSTNGYNIILGNDGDIGEATSVVPVFTGATDSKSGELGLVPKPTMGDIGKYLRGDGTWVTPDNTWIPNSVSDAGYVTAPGSSNLNKVWKTDENGNPNWRDDSDFNVAQQNTLSNKDFRVLLSYEANDDNIINVINKSSKLTFNPDSGTLTSTRFVGSLDGLHVDKLTQYTKKSESDSINTEDSLNDALGKLEYKADLGKEAYTWYKSITVDDTDGYINKWQEIVDFLNNVKDDTNILDEFVTRKTQQTIVGLKTFECQPIFAALQDTSPFKVTSTTKVEKLNADLLDGYHSDHFATGFRFNGNSGDTYYGILKANVKSFDRDKLVYGYLGHGSASFAYGWVLSYEHEGKPYCGFLVDDNYGNNWRLVSCAAGNWKDYAIIHSENYTYYNPLVNGSHADNATTIYAPTTSGTLNYILTSEGNKAPIWKNPSDIVIGTATNLADKPSLNTVSDDPNQITVTAGCKTSDAFTVPYSQRSSSLKASSVSITSTAADTTTNWGALGNTIHFYLQKNQLTDQPSNYGLLVNFNNSGSEVHQLWMTQATGSIYHRGGNGSGWQGTWRELIDSYNCVNYIAYPTAFSWTNGTTAGPTGSLTGTNMDPISFGAIPSASSSTSGVVTTTDQVFSGFKAFQDGINIKYVFREDENWGAPILFGDKNAPDTGIVGFPQGLELYSSGEIVLVCGQDFYWFGQGEALLAETFVSGEVDSLESYYTPPTPLILYETLNTYEGNYETATIPISGGTGQIFIGLRNIPINGDNTTVQYTVPPGKELCITFTTNTNSLQVQGTNSPGIYDVYSYTLSIGTCYKAVLESVVDGRTITLQEQALGPTLASSKVTHSSSNVIRWQNGYLSDRVVTFRISTVPGSIKISNIYTSSNSNQFTSGPLTFNLKGLVTSAYLFTPAQDSKYPRGNSLSRYGSNGWVVIDEENVSYRANGTWFEKVGTKCIQLNSEGFTYSDDSGKTWQSFV